MMRNYLAKISYHHDFIFLEDKFAKIKKKVHELRYCITKYLNSKLKVCQNTFFFYSKYLFVILISES